MTWSQAFQDQYVDALLSAESRGHHLDRCDNISCQALNPMFRCRDCFGRWLYCQDCILQRYRTNPLHWIEVKFSTYSTLPSSWHFSAMEWKIFRQKPVQKNTSKAIVFNWIMYQVSSVQLNPPSLRILLSSMSTASIKLISTSVVALMHPCLVISWSNLVGGHQPRRALRWPQPRMFCTLFWLTIIEVRLHWWIITEGLRNWLVLRDWQIYQFILNHPYLVIFDPSHRIDLLNGC